MGLRLRMRRKLGPIRINLSRSGVSTSLTVGGVTINPKRRRAWVNLPGPFYWTQSLPKKRPR